MPAAPQAAVEPIREGSRWRYAKPDSDAVASWFQTVPLDEPLSPPVAVGVGQSVGIGSYWEDVCAPARPPFHVRVSLPIGGGASPSPIDVPTEGSGPPECISSRTTRAGLPSGTLLLFLIGVSNQPGNWEPTSGNP